MAITITYSLTTLQSQAQGNGFTGGTQFGSDVIGLANGGYAVAYGNPDGTAGEDFPRFSLRNSSFSQTVAAGVPNAANGIDMRGNPEMALLANGNIVIVWDEGPGAPGGPAAADDVVGAIINPTTGAVIHSEFQVSSFGSDTDPEVAGLTNGNFVVAMTNDISVYLQLMSSTGGQIGGQIFVDVGTDIDPVIAGLQDGLSGFAVAFANSANATVYVQTFNADGSERTANPILTGTGAYTPAVAAMPNGNFALVYQDDNWPSNGGLTLQIIDPNGTNVTPGGRVEVDDSTFLSASNPDVTVLADGSILVAWDRYYGPVEKAVFARLLSSTGVPLTNVFGIEGDTSSFTDPSVSHIRQGVFVTSWTDGDSDGSGGRISTNVSEFYRDVTSNAADDTLTGSAIRDVFDGNGGNDTVDYGSSAAAVQANLLTGLGSGGDAQGDSYSEIENLSGTDFADALTGNGGNNRLLGGIGNDTMTGGNGNDTYVDAETSDIIVEAAAGGTDTVEAYVTSFSLAALAQVENLTFLAPGAVPNFVGRGNGLDNRIQGNVGNDRFVVDAGGADRYFGDTGVSDTMDFRPSATGAIVNLTTGIHGGAAAGDFYSSIEYFYGSDTAGDNFTGGAFNDRLDGYGGADALSGLGGNDTIMGGEGDDEISGGALLDFLHGNAGADDFNYSALSDSGPTGGARDRIYDFSVGSDDIDVSAIDASAAGAGNNAFTGFLGGAAFTGEAQVRWYQSGANTVIEFNTSGASGAEMQIQLQAFTAATLTAADFVA